MKKDSITMFILISFLILFACSKDNSTDPVDETIVYEELFSEIFGADIEDGAVITTVDSAEIDISLGLETGDSTEITLDMETIYIIAGDSTVSSATDLSIHCRLLNFDLGNDTTMVAMYFNCLPDGLEFDNSLIIDVGSACFNNHPTSNAVRLYQYNASSHRWTTLIALQKTNPRLQFEIDHFSKYAIAD